MKKRGRKQIEPLESSLRRCFTIVFALLVVQDYIMQTWVIDSGAPFHCIRSKECFLSFFAGNFRKVYLGNNHACNIEGLVTMRVAMENGQELTIDQIRFVSEIKKCSMSVEQLDL